MVFIKNNDFIAFLLIALTFNAYSMELLVSEESTQKELNAGLLTAVRKKDCPMIKELLNNGADINTVSPGGLTPLMFAVIPNYLDVVQCLLNNPNIAINQQRPSDGNTALLMALRKKDKSIIPILKLLLDAGADPELANNAGLTPRNAAIQVIYPRGYSEAVESFDPFAANQRRLNALNVPIQSDAEILSLIHKAILKKHGAVNPFTRTQKEDL